MPTTTRAQIGMDDNFIENPELQELLEQREEEKSFTQHAKTTAQIKTLKVPV